jgi:hypothetical protein
MKTGTKIQLAALFDACVCGSKIKNEKTAKKRNRKHESYGDKKKGFARVRRRCP